MSASSKQICQVLMFTLFAPVAAATETVAIEKATVDYIDSDGYLVYKAAADGERVKFNEGAPIVYALKDSAEAGATFYQNRATFDPFDNASYLTVLNDLKLYDDRDGCRIMVTCGETEFSGTISQKEGVTSGGVYKMGDGTARFTGNIALPGMTFRPGAGVTVFDGGTNTIGRTYTIGRLETNSETLQTLVITNDAKVTFGSTGFGMVDNSETHVLMSGGDVTVTGGFNLSRSKNPAVMWRMDGGTLSWGSDVTFGFEGGSAHFSLNGGQVVSSVHDYFRIGNSGKDGNETRAVLQINGGEMCLHHTMISFAYYPPVIGNLRVSGGQLNVPDGSVMFGRQGTNYTTVTGGALSFLSRNGEREFSLARWGEGSGRIDMTGGRFAVGDGFSFMRIGNGGPGVVSVAAQAVFSSTNVVNLAAETTASGEIALYEGGVFEAPRIVSGKGVQKVTADGGTLRVLGDGQTVDFLGPLDASFVGRRGITFDTGNNTATVTDEDFAADGQSVGAVRKAGAGTLVLQKLPQTHGGVAVQAGTLRLASGATVGAPYAPTVQAEEGNVYPENPSTELIANNYLLHRWSFTGGSLVDSIAGREATLHSDDTAQGAGIWENRAILGGGGTKGVRYLELGSGLFGTEDGAFTIEFWTQSSAWSSENTKLLVVGNDSPNEMFLNADWLTRARKNNDEGSNPGYMTNRERKNGAVYHVSIVMDAPAADGTRTITFRQKNAATGETLGYSVVEKTPYSPVELQNHFNLGYVPWHAEKDVRADYDEVRIWRAGLSDAQLTENALLGPDTLPVLAAALGTGPLAVSSGATFDLGGNAISYGALTGAGTVANGTLTVGDIVVDGTLQLTADVTVTGTVDFGAGDKIVTSGTLDLSQATVRYTGEVPATRTMLVSTAGEGQIVGTPARVVEGGAGVIGVTSGGVTLARRAFTIYLH